MELSAQELRDLLDPKSTNATVFVSNGEPENNLCPFAGRIAIVRTESAGVFIGKIAGRKGSEILLHNARRLWRWSGAASLSQLAIDGTSDPDSCKFPAPVDEIILLGVIEIIPATVKSIDSIKEVSIWAA